MTVTSDYTGAGRTDDQFLVRYSGQYPNFYMARTLPFLAVFALLTLLYLDDESRRMIFSRKGATYKPFSWYEFGLLLILVAAPLLDLALTLRRVQRGAVALCISAEGIKGMVFHRTRLFPWSEVSDVVVDGKFIVVRRHRKTSVWKLFASRGIGDINIPEHHMDRGVEEIRTAVRQFAPVHHNRGAAQ